MTNPDLRIDEKAEGHILGMMMSGESNNGIAALAVSLLGHDASVFGNNRHQIIYRAILQLSAENKPVDQYTAAAQLTQEEFNRVGCDEEFDRLVVCPAPTIEGVEYFCDIVKDLQAERKIQLTGRQIPSIIQEDIPLAAKVDKIESKIFDAMQGRSEGKEEHFVDQIDASLAYIDKMRSADEPYEMATGFAKLDILTLGWHRGEMTMIGGVPGVGKSAFVHNTILYSLRKKIPCLLWDYESTPEILIQRMAASMAQVNLYNILSGRLNDENYQKVNDAHAELAMLPLILPRINPNIQELAAVTRHEKIKNPDLAIVAIDHLQRVPVPGLDGLREQVTEVSKTLKDIAVQTGVAVLAISILTRGLDVTDEPKMYNLRESGSLEFDADGIFFLWQPEYADPQSRMLTCAKQRNRPKDRIPFRFEGGTMTYGEV